MAGLWTLALLAAAPATAAPPTSEPVIVPAPATPAEEHAASEIVTIGPAEEAAPDPATWLEGRSSVQVRRTGDAGQPARVGLRGADSQQTAVSLDGVPLGSPIGGGADLSILPIEGLRDVRILRGGLSDHAGSDAMGGLIAFRTRDAAPGWQWGARAQAGSLGSLRGGGWAGYGGERLAGRLSVSGHLNAGRFDFVDDQGRRRPRENNDSRSVSALATASVRLSRGARLRLSHLSHAGERGVAGAAAFPTPEARQESLHTVTALSGRSPWWGSVRLEGQLAHRLERSRFVDPAPGFGPPAQQRALLHTAHASTTAKVRAGRHDLSLQVAARLDRARISPDPGARELRVTEGRVAIAAHDDWMIVDGAAGSLSLRAGGRVERWRSMSPEFGLRGGIAWHATSGWWLRAGGGRAYRLPTLSERFVDLGFVRGDPDILAEVGWTADVEAGLRRGRWEVAITPYVAYYDRMILFLPASLFETVATNARDAWIVGVESRASFLVTLRDELSAAWTVTRGRFSAPDAPLTGLPTHAGRIAWRGRRGPWRWGLGAVARSGVALDRFGSLREEGRVMAHALLGLRVGSTRWDLRVDNLLDKRDATDHLQQPLPGLTALLTLRVDGGGASGVEPSR